MNFEFGKSYRISFTEIPLTHLIQDHGKDRESKSQLKPQGLVGNFPCKVRGSQGTKWLGQS